MTDSWHSSFGKLLKYKEVYGDCLVPDTYPVDQRFSNWIGSQRAARQNGSITLERMQQLDSIGFVWNVEEHRWERMFQALQEFKNRHGHCEPRPDEVDKQLYVWIQTQRNYLKYNKHPIERALRLAALGISHGTNIAWNRHFAELRDFSKRHGHCNILRQFQADHGHPDISCSPFHNTLYYWLRQQRLDFESGCLPDEKRKALEELGVKLIRRQRKLLIEEMLPRLREFRERHDHLRIRKEDDPKLHRWCIAQRSARRRGRLKEVYISALDDIAFPWSEEDAIAQEMIVRLTLFRSHFGHVDISDEDDQELACWIRDQRTRWDMRELPEDRITVLEMLGVVKESGEDKRANKENAAYG